MREKHSSLQEHWGQVSEPGELSGIIPEPTEGVSEAAEAHVSPATPPGSGPEAVCGARPLWRSQPAWALQMRPRVCGSRWGTTWEMD